MFQIGIQNVVLLLILQQMIQQSNQWWQFGHMMVARIAEVELQASYPEVYDRANQLVTALNPLCNNLSQTFVQSAPWADDLKTSGLSYLTSMHFVNHIYDLDGIFVTDQDFKHDVIVGLEQCKQVLINNSTKGQTTMEKAMMMRYLIHLVGDLHQPLHTSQMFSLFYTEGDEGGNLIKVKDGNMQTPCPELHAFWDSGAYRWPGAVGDLRPLNESGQSQVYSYAKEIAASHPRSIFETELNEKNITMWGVEGFHQAVEHAYKPLQKHFESGEPFQLPESYKHSSYAVMRKRIALAGYRLADLIAEYIQAEQSV